MSSSKYDGSTIEVINWAKYNPRTDSKKPTWFRFENNLATGAGFFELDCEQKWLWVVILSLVSQANGEAIVWNSAYIRNLTGIKPKKQEATLEIFEKFTRLRVSREVNKRVSPATNERTHATHGRTDDTDETQKKIIPAEFVERRDREPEETHVSGVGERDPDAETMEAQRKLERKRVAMGLSADGYPKNWPLRGVGS